MKQKTKLSYRLQKKDIQGTHLAMSPNGKHVALKMADSLVIAHDISIGQVDLSAWIAIHIHPTHYDITINSVVVKTVKHTTDFSSRCECIDVSDNGDVSLLYWSEDGKQLISYKSKDQRKALKGETTHFTPEVYAGDTYGLDTIHYRPRSSELYGVELSGLVVNLTNDIVVDSDVFGYVAISPKGEVICVEYNDLAYHFLSASGKYVADVIIPPYLNHNHATVNIKPTKGDCVKTSLVLKRPVKSEYWIPSVNVSDNGKVFWVCNEHGLKSKSCDYSVVVSMHPARNGYTEWSEMLHYMDVRRLASGNSFTIDQSGYRIAYVSTTNCLTVADMVE